MSELVLFGGVIIGAGNKKPPIKPPDMFEEFITSLDTKTQQIDFIRLVINANKREITRIILILALRAVALQRSKSFPTILSNLLRRFSSLVNSGRKKTCYKQVF